jgi:hypothetical protein
MLTFVRLTRYVSEKTLLPVTSSTLEARGWSAQTHDRQRPARARKQRSSRTHTKGGQARITWIQAAVRESPRR